MIVFQTFLIVLADLVKRDIMSQGVNMSLYVSFCVTVYHCNEAVGRWSLTYILRLSIVAGAVVKCMKCGV